MSTEGFRYEVVAEDGPARAGRFITPHAVIETPVFMPVGTQATVKTQTPAEIEATGARIILANTYHLMLRPTAELVAQLGGVRRFMRWPHALPTAAATKSSRSPACARSTTTASCSARTSTAVSTR